MQDEYSRMQRSAMAAGSPTAVKDGWESVKDAGQRVKGEEGQAKPPPPHEEGPQLCPEGSNPFSVSPLTTPCATQVGTGGPQSGTNGTLSSGRVRSARS